MLKFNKRFFLFLLTINFILLVSVNANELNDDKSKTEKSGRIVGVISDSLSNNPLAGANVVIVGTYIGASSDINGEYSILNVSSGKVTIEASYMGYKSKKVIVDVKAGKAVMVNFDLVQDIVMGEEVVITAQRKGQLAAINQQLQSEKIVNVVSPERIRELPDANAAESVARLPGVSLTRSSGEGQGIIIRGLSPKYNTIMVNGVALSTSSAEDRGVSISGVSPVTVGGIEVYKAITADMDADNIGGAVNLVMKKAQSEPEYAVRLFGAYNAMAKDFGQYKGFARLNRRLFDDKLGIQASLNAERRNRSRDKMRASFYQKTNYADSSVYYEISSASIEKREEIRSRYGGSLILDYGTNENSILFSNLFSYGKSSALTRQHQYDGSQGNVIPIQSEYTGYSFVNTLEGKHQVWSSLLDWNVGYSKSHSETPFYHSVRFEEKGVGMGDADVKMDPEDFLAALPVDSTAQFYEANYYRSKTEENRLSAKFDMKTPFNLFSNISSFFKFGGKITHLTRSNDEQNGHAITTFLSEPKTSLDFWIDRGYDPGEVLNGRTTLGLTLDPSKNRAFFDDLMTRPENSFYGNDNVFAGGNHDYTATENIAATYAMMQFKYKDIVSFTPGVRYETEFSTYNGHYRLITMPVTPYDGIYRDTTATRNLGYWFPMIHLKIQPVSIFDIRLAYTKTISRPNYSYLIPSETIESTRSDAYISLGKTSLKPALSSNYDANFALHGWAGFFSVGLFYKEIVDFSYGLTPQIKDSAEAAYYDLHPENFYVGRWVTTRVNSHGTSTVKGIEFDLQPNLTLLPGFLSGIVLYANLTFINSSSWLTKRKLTIDYSSWPFKYNWEIGFREGPMPDQAKYTANLSIGYDIGGFSARGSMFKQGSSLSSPGPIEEEDVYVDEFTRFDFSIKYDFNDNFTLYLTGQNLGNEPDTRRQANTTKYRMVEYFGAMYDFGFQYKF
jgi:outer membrane receptor protein involved in Fe transport